MGLSVQKFKQLFCAESGELIRLHLRDCEQCRGGLLSLARSVLDEYPVLKMIFKIEDVKVAYEGWLNESIIKPTNGEGA